VTVSTSVAIDMAMPKPRSIGADVPERRSSALPIMLVLFLLAAGAGYAVLHARDQRHSDPTLPPPTIIFLGAATSTSASPTEPSSCAPTATPSPSTPHPPPPVAKKTTPVPRPVDPHPHPPGPATAASTVVKLPPLPPEASDIPLSPAKIVPVTISR
jgi:hypothetical protein